MVGVCYPGVKAGVFCRGGGKAVGALTLVLGGSASGKSETAECLAGSLGAPVTYVATMAASDGETAERIARHRRRRPAAWTTVEETHRLAAAVTRYGQGGGVLLVEDLTTWLANLLTDPREGAGEEAVLAAVDEVLAAVERAPARVVVVADEVGWGLVPPYPLGRVFRDLAGRANQRVAARAGRVYLVVAGLRMTLKE